MPVNGEIALARGGGLEMAGPRRLQQRSLDTRDRLVEAALHVFAARGFDGATTREIAKDAGVALAALPYHFETKDALWRAAADRIFGVLRADFEARSRGLEGADLPTRLRLLLREFVLFAARHPELHRFMLQEGTERGTRLAWLVETHVRPLFDAARALLGEAQAQGILPDGRLEHLFYAMIGAASMPYAVAPEYELLTGQDPRAKPLVEQHVETLLRLFEGDRSR
jgi:AcrR family transcriptional regulator